MLNLQLSDLQVVDGDEDPRVQDLRLAEILGLGRLRDVRQLIERNREDLEEYASLRCRTAVIGAGKGALHEVQEYWLTEGQALRICSLSKTKNAKRATKVIIDVFIAWRRGKLPPRDGEAATFLPAVRQMFDEGLNPIRKEQAEQRMEIIKINENVIHVSSRIDALESRRPIPEDHQQLYRRVVLKFNAGKCPCCRRVTIVNPDGSKTERCHAEHWNGPKQIRKEDCWLTCDKCNQNLRDIEFKARHRTHFEVFQDNLRDELQNFCSRRTTKAGKTKHCCVTPDLFRSGK
jgi:hypothetical protein